MREQNGREPEPNSTLPVESSALEKDGSNSAFAWKDPSAAQPRGRRLAFFVGSGGRPVAIEPLLRDRLRFLALLVIPLFVALIVLVDLPKFRSQRLEVAADGNEYVVAHLAMALVALGLVLALRVGLDSSLSRLRSAEVILFGALCAEFAWIQWHEFHDPLTAKLRDTSGIVASAASLGWVVIIVFYGTFIPNNWRRCAIAVSLIAVCPLATAAVASLTNESIRLFVFGPFLVYLTLWMILAVSIVTFGAYGIDLLRNEATEARQVGQYHLRTLLKSGGMGEIYLAEHVLMKRHVVIKLIREKHASDPEYIHRFEREVRAMAKLTHWNTVQVFDYGLTEDGTFYYVMEYLPGLNLEEMIQQGGPLPPGRAVHFLKKICDALREAHSIGLIHRDITPSNVLVCKRGGLCDVIKLLDFGLVRHISLPTADTGTSVAARDLDVGTNFDTVPGLIAGTPSYMSPEQILTNDRVTHRSDIYGVGALAYFLLTGRPPFVRPNLKAVLAAQLHEEVEPPSRLRPGLPADLEGILLTCLIKDPDRRFPNVEALGAALAGCRCAGDWTPELAASWWEGNFTAETPESEFSLASASKSGDNFPRSAVSCILAPSDLTGQRTTPRPS